MAVQRADVIDSTGSTATTLFGAGTSYPGKRIVVGLSDRGGGVTASVFLDGVEFDSVGSIVYPGTNRRSMFMFEGTVAAEPNNPILSSSVLDGGGAAVSHTEIAIITDETYPFVGFAVADSGESTTTTQGTGTTAEQAGGDVMLVSLETARGNPGTPTWSTTTRTPPNPAGGNWDLQVLQASGADANKRQSSMGVAFLTGQASSTRSASCGFTTARMAAGMIAVFATSTGGATHTASVTSPVTASLSAAVATTTPATATLGVQADVAPVVDVVRPADSALTIGADVGVTSLAEHPVTAAVDAVAGIAAQADIGVFPVAVDLEITADVSAAVSATLVAAPAPAAVSTVEAFTSVTHTATADVQAQAAIAATAIRESSVPDVRPTVDVTIAVAATRHSRVATVAATRTGRTLGATRRGLAVGDTRTGHEIGLTRTERLP